MAAKPNKAARMAAVKKRNKAHAVKLRKQTRASNLKHRALLREQLGTMKP